MIARFARRMLTETDPRLLTKFAVNFALRGAVSLLRYKYRRRRGRQYPPFLFLSVTNRCNLRCQGCWVATDAEPTDMDLPTMDRLVRTSKRHGGHFFGILGGEPVLHPRLMDLFRRHGDCYFQLFTNGTLIDDEYAADLRKVGNVTPLVSIEGLETTSDVRRGGNDVYARTLRGLDACLRQGLVTGVATSVCRSNIDELINERFVNALVDLGVHYAWYYCYRPAGPDPAPELALSKDQVARLRRFLVETRAKAPLLLVDTYWDHQGRALCPAAAGISYHVNPWGDVEPCPPLQFGCENVHDAPDFTALIEGSGFLRDVRSLMDRTCRGCILLEDPARLREFVVDRQARDTGKRGRGLEELARMSPAPSQDMDGGAIPEKHWLYRLAKRYWFFGFGGYG